MTSPGVIEYREVSVPKKISENEVLLRIQKIGVCGSDIHVWHGKHPFTSYPIVQGHEYCGEVIEVGHEVTLLKPGDKATARPQLVCGTCNPCKKGHHNVCMNLKVQGFQANGGAQDNKVKDVLAENVEGRKAVMAKAVIDCTGNGDLFARAGESFTLSDRLQPMTDNFFFAEVDQDSEIPYDEEVMIPSGSGQPAGPLSMSAKSGETPRILPVESIQMELKKQQGIIEI